MDSYYLNDAVEKLNEFLSKADNPKFTGEIVFQRRAPHCWGPRGAGAADEDGRADRAVRAGRRRPQELALLSARLGRSDHFARYPCHTHSSACG